MSILPTGPLPLNPSELLGSPKMGLLIEVFGAYSDIIIDDAPPITAVTDAIILASKVASVLGYVMNDFPRPKAERYNTYYGSTD